MKREKSVVKTLKFCENLEGFQEEIVEDVEKHPSSTV
jgi:hypothetical protein